MKVVVKGKRESRDIAKQGYRDFRDALVEVEVRFSPDRNCSITFIPTLSSELGRFLQALSVPELSTS